MLLFISIPIAMLVFWVLMLVHAARHDIEDKAVWVLVIILGQIVGAIAYYFAIKKPYDQQQKVNGPPNSA